MRAKIARALRVVSENRQANLPSASRRLTASSIASARPDAPRMEPLEGRQLLSTYYVSPSGSDSASGTSTASAWRSVSRVNSQSLHSGDRVLFKGGSSFSGGLYVPSAEHGVTFG